MVHLPDELIVKIIAISLDFENNPEHSQHVRLTNASSKAVLTLRTVNRTIKRCATDFFPYVLQERPVRLLPIDLNMLEMITRDEAFCKHTRSLCISTASSILGLFGRRVEPPGGHSLETELTNKYEYHAEYQRVTYEVAGTWLAYILARLCKLEEVYIECGRTFTFPLPDQLQGQLSDSIEHALCRYPRDIKGSKDLKAVYATLAALQESASTPKRINILKLPIIALGIERFAHLSGGLPSVSSLDLDLFVAEQFDDHRWHTPHVRFNSRTMSSIYSIFPSMDSLRITNIHGEPHSDIFLNEALVFSESLSQPSVNSLTTLELGVGFGFWDDAFFNSFSLAAGHHRNTLRHVAIFPIKGPTSFRIRVRRFVLPLEAAGVRLDTFYLQYCEMAPVDDTVFGTIPWPLGFAKRAFIRQMPEEYSPTPAPQSYPRLADEVLWKEDWAGPTGSHGYYAGDLEMWFGDVENKRSKEAWAPPRL
ncbi:hypothetical protein SLS58_006430 [Diplodia intermedia]|uniref:F-box domain-containing protein n=1 Tax=Diplodia intermedia TaxID=856260 RepID=A0ABR3TNE2_9PEZI